MIMDFKALAKEAPEELRKRKPLVHCITNYVTAGASADFLLAAGASPIMADSPEECGEITEGADCLVINIGTPDSEKVKAMAVSARTAFSRKIPIIFDPVGIGASGFRAKAMEAIFNWDIAPDAIKGNLSEICRIAGIASHIRGVDSGSEEVSPRYAAFTAAVKLKTVIAVTGADDIVTDGKRRMELRNGTPMLCRITGAGCMEAALCGAFSAIYGGYYGTALGISYMNICAELAESDSKGRTGAFRTALFDYAGELNGEIFSERLEYYETD